MKKTLLIIIFLTITFSALRAQNQSNEFVTTDKIALQIPDSATKTTEGISKYITSNFHTEGEKVRAIFIWLATNIQYDLDNMFAINLYEKEEEKIAKPLRTRKGICENFAVLFNEICSKSGISSYMIDGYTKQNGFASYIPHAWNAARVDSVWYLFDATWASGYVSNGKFIKKLSNSYYKVPPSVLIKSHMPFDYLWQFLNYPVSNSEFYEGKVDQNRSKPFFSFADSIQVHENLGSIEQLIASAERIEKNGTKNAMIFDRLHHIKVQIENDKQASVVNLYNAAVVDYNEGINSFNEFIQYRNKQFKPKKTDAQIQEMMDVPANHIKEARSKLQAIKEPNENTASLMQQLNKGITDVAKQVKEQQDWLNIYFSKGKAGRVSMFYETKTWWD